MFMRLLWVVGGEPLTFVSETSLNREGEGCQGCILFATTGGSAAQRLGVRWRQLCGRVFAGYTRQAGW